MLGEETVIMDTILILLGVVLVVVFVSWVNRNRKLQMLVAAFKKVADEEQGEVVTGGLSLRPRLRLTYAGKPLEVSFAATGTSISQASEYSFALFREMPETSLRFQILPITGKKIIERQIGLKDRALTGHADVDANFVIHANDAEKLRVLLTPEVVQDLAMWAKPESQPRLGEIRNFDDKLVFCANTLLDRPQDIQLLVSSAKILADAYMATV